jgi:rod shape-determining protein MreC
MTPARLEDVLRRVAVFVVIIAGIAIILLNLPPAGSQQTKSFLSELVTPFYVSARSGAAWVLDLFGSVGRVSEAMDRNRKLETEVAILRQRMDGLHALERENDQLRQQLAFRKRRSQRVVLGEVIARDDVSGWWRSVRINCGTADGIVANRPVVTTQGLVGKTLIPSRNACDVLLLTDPTLKVSCRLPRSGGHGIMKGMGVRPASRGTLELMCPPQPFRIDYVALEHEIQPGDEVLTSGLGGVYPGGVVVGYVKTVDVEPGGLYRTATVVPSAELGALQYVFVLVE